MRIDVVGRDFDITDAIRTHAETKGEKLLRYFDRTQQITYTISQKAHKGSGNGEFHVELTVDVEHHDAFISNAHGDDLYGTIDHVTQRGARQLTDFKEKLKLEKR